MQLLFRFLKIVYYPLVWIVGKDRTGAGRLFGLILQHRALIATSVLLMLGYVLFNALPAWYAKDVVDSLRSGKVPEISRFVLVGVAIFLIFVIKGAFHFGHTYLMGLAGQRLIFNLRRDLYAHLQTLSYTFFSNRSSGELISRFTSDLITLQNAVRVSVVGPLRDVPQVVVFLGILLFRSWQLFLVSLVIIPMAAGLIRQFGRRNKRMTGRRLNSYGRMTGLLMETVSGFRVVKAFGMEAYERDRFEETNQELMKYNLRSIRIQSYSNPLLEATGAAAGAVIIMFGGWLIIHQAITPGDFVSFLLAFMMLHDPVRKLNGFNMQLQEGVAAANRVFELLDVPPQEVDPPGAPDLPVISDGLHVHVDRFCHDSNPEPVLQDVDLDVKVGQVVALVGPSGAGKTTLVNLIPRFFNLQEGHITVDGRDITQHTLASLRRQVAIVTQEVFLFNDTVANNIAYGNIERPREDIVEAAKAAYAHDFIMELPHGYDTSIGEGGMHLSGGQRQRLSIARALIKDAPILILDEATSALDSESEQAVQKAIDALIENRTTIVIAHRLSTIRRADKICVMERGRIVETGRHDELLRRGGIYKRLYEMQFQDAQSMVEEHRPWHRLWKRVRGSEEPLQESG